MFLALAFCVVTAQAQSEQWKSYSYAADGFSISAPSEPVLHKQDVPTEKGSFELRGYLVEIGDTACYVGVVDYGSAVNGRDPASVLQGAKTGAINNVKAHLLQEAKITLGNNPGVSYEAENETLHFSARDYLVGTVLYQVIVVSPISKPYAETVRFLDSFQLIAH